MAKSEQDGDWQSTKNTVLERSRHMFNNPFMSDIMFSCEGSDKKFFAHKYVLSTSSAVFYAMFYGELAEKNSVVQLSDTNDEILEEFLRFLYTDECKLTPDNAMFVLYLAKKYIVPSLGQRCIKFLEANLAVENAFTILQQAIQFDEKKLEKKCWDLIDLKTTEAVASDAFVDIDQATLEKLLKRESLNVKEVDVFKAVIKWSEAECSRKGIKKTTTKKTRAVMGNAIYQIRFASMTLQEFGQNVSQSGILTPEENVLFFEKFSGVERASEVWNLSERRPRKRTLIKCRRFDKYRARLVMYITRTSVHALCVSFSKPVNFHGVRFLGKEGAEYDVKLDVFSQSVSGKFRSQRDSRGISGFDVMLPAPIQVQANVVVQLIATVTGMNTETIGSNGRKAVETNGITVNFFDVADINFSYTTVEQGQLDDIIFSEI